MPSGYSRRPPDTQKLPAVMDFQHDAWFERIDRAQNGQRFSVWA